MSKSAFDTQVAGNHYKSMKIQPIQFAEENELTPMEFSVVKYVVRHRVKNGLEDLKKAVHYLQMMMELHYDCNMHVSYTGKQHDDDSETDS